MNALVFVMVTIYYCLFRFCSLFHVFIYNILFTAHVEVDATPNQNTNPAQSPSASSSTFNHVPKKRKHHLSTTSDSLYMELCDANFAVVGNILNRVARRISSDYESRHSAKTSSQLREFAGRLGGLQADHTSLRLRMYQCDLYPILYLSI